VELAGAGSARAGVVGRVVLHFPGLALIPLHPGCFGLVYA